MTNFDGIVVDVALPKLQTAFATNMAGLQWILNAYHLPVASLLVASGSLGDRCGRKRVFLAGLGLFTAASAVCGFAPNLTVLLLGRIVQGVGAAALMPLSLTILTAVFTEAKARTQAIAIWTAISVLALVIGPASGGLLMDALGWQSLFWINLPLGGLTFFAASRIVLPAEPAKRQHLAVPSLLLSIVVMASLTWLLTEVGGGLSARLLALAAIATASVLGFIAAESHARHPMLPPLLLKNSTFAVANLTQGLVFFASGGLVFMFSLFLQQVQGHSAAGTGLRFLPMNAAIVGASLLSGWVAAKFGGRFSIIVGLAVAGVAALGLSQLGAETVYAKIAIGLILSGFGGGLTIAPLTAIAMNAVESAHEGIASALLNVGIQIGGIVGIALQGAIFSRRLAASLGRSLVELGLPADARDRLVTRAAQHVTQLPENFPYEISQTSFDLAIDNAFVSGLQTALFVASLTLLSGSLLMAKTLAKSKPIRPAMGSTNA